jgi:hypothetical protein
MDQQEVVFDEKFYQGINERRRAIMPLGLKIYVWIGMVTGVLIFISPFITALGRRPEDAVPLRYTWLLIAVTAPFGAAIFMMTFFLWSEVKWAIKFNWVTGAFWLFCVCLGFLVGDQGFRYLISFSFLVPYWIWLYRIQEKWENTAVSGKQVKQQLE